jgi:hypothetical protein
LCCFIWVFGMWIGSWGLIAVTYRVSYRHFVEHVLSIGSSYGVLILRL